MSNLFRIIKVKKIELSKDPFIERSYYWKKEY